MYSAMFGKIAEVTSRDFMISGLSFHSNVTLKKLLQIQKGRKRKRGEYNNVFPVCI